MRWSNHAIEIGMKDKGDFVSRFSDVYNIKHLLFILHFLPDEDRPF